MQLSLRRLSLIGIAFVLVNCGVSDSSDDEGSAQDSMMTGTSSPAAAKQKDVRSGLTAVSGNAVGAAFARSGNLAADARAYAERVARDHGVKNPSFSDFSIAQGNDGLSHVRLVQLHEGLKVWGADVVVHAAGASLTSLAGSMATTVDGLDMPAYARAKTLSGSEALARAKADRFGGAPVATSRESSEKVVWIDGGGKPRVAIHTEFFNELQGNTAPGLWNHMFDAATGELLSSWNGIETETVVQGSGPGGNPRNVHSWNQELDLVAQGDSYLATTTRLNTVNMKTLETGAGTPVTGPLDPFSDAPIDDAHGYAEIVLNVLTAMGHNSIDDNGFQILSRVHYGVNYENAFWDGTQMTYGDGHTTFYPLSGSLDVVAHEIHHGYTTKHSNLAYAGEPGGLNEGFSDIAGKTAEWMYAAAPTFDLGANIFKQDGAALRYMCNPTKDGVSIDNAANMTASLDPHYSSGVPNKFFCRLAKRYAGNVDGDATKDSVHKAAVPVYLANAHYWTSSTTFIQACQGTIDAARTLQYSEDDVTAIRQSWIDVGVYCDGAIQPPPPCGEILSGATGTVTSPNYPNNYPDSFAKTWCIDAPAGQQVTLTFGAFETESGYDFVSVGDKTGAVAQKVSGTTGPTPITSSRVYLIFKSDSTVNKKGWTASWTTQ
jgi:pseudolysin/vibriolysin